MAMERRLHPRERVVCQAAVHYPPLGLVLSRIRDVSIDGMCVDTTPITLNFNTAVDITVRRQGKGEEGFSRFRALVVWAEDGRAGLMLSSVDDDACEALQGLRQLARRASYGTPKTSWSKRAVPGA